MSDEAAEDREAFRAYLRDHNLPVTAQRMAIAEVVLGTDRHVSADEVARALDALLEAGREDLEARQFSAADALVGIAAGAALVLLAHPLTAPWLAVGLVVVGLLHLRQIDRLAGLAAAGLGALGLAGNDDAGRHMGDAYGGISGVDVLSTST